MVARDVEARWEGVESAVLSAVGDARYVVVRIPGWEPTGFDTGLFWLRTSVYEGLQVDFLVEESSDSHVVLWLKSWEWWDPETPSGDEVPSWDAIKATPTRS